MGDKAKNELLALANRLKIGREKGAEWRKEHGDSFTSPSEIWNVLDEFWTKWNLHPSQKQKEAVAKAFAKRAPKK